MAEDVLIRPGRRGDDVALLAMWDAAIAWLVARGQATQWGTEPASAGRRHRELVTEWVAGDGLSMAEVDGRAVGASVVTDAPPPHVPPAPVPETYLMFLISDRAHAGRGIGARLVRHAADGARRAGSRQLRVDCWAGAPDLVAFYEAQGFVKSATFSVDVRGGWHGQVFEMAL